MKITKCFISSILLFISYILIIFIFSLIYFNNSSEFNFNENLNDELYLFAKYESENITQKLLKIII
ncbi:MAG: hypothetical protein KQ78_01545 [Candidatus Izimaplasma bacterium HR2]|nr:MAG: hypothetical protein KQ78_01545 [Candidatus Izimaplasma bacterium HR2]